MRKTVRTANVLVATLSVAVAPPTLSGQDTSWVATSALYEIFVQDFSPRGDLRGVIEGLDRIQSVGANVIWLMPVQPVSVEKRKGTLGSRYAIRDYYAVDPTYGTAADFRELIQAAHARGIKVILDWVPDHTGWDHVWLKQHPEYYVRDEKGQPSVPRDPGGKLTDWTDVAQLDFRNAGLRKAMIDAMRHWLVEYELDGFRVDVAGFVPNDFWREALPVLRAAVPRRILLLAEWGDLEMHRVGYDLSYAWDTYSRLKEVWQGKPASMLVSREIEDLSKMPPGGRRLRFSTNHDETAWDAPPVTKFGGAAGARAAFVAMVTLPGRPLIYNGQEVESPQKLGLFEKEAVVWDQPDAGAALAYYTRVMQLTRTEPGLIGLDLQAVETSLPNDIIAFQRGDLIVLVNARPREATFTLANPAPGGWRDLLSGRTQQGKTIRLPAHGTAILKRSN